MHPISLILLLFSFFSLQAAHLNEEESSSQTSTSLIPNGIRVTKGDKQFGYMRQILSDVGSCSAVDIGCDFLLTAGHCKADKGKVTLGIDGETEVGTVQKSYTPLEKEPKNLDDFVRADFASSDIRLVKVKYDSKIPHPLASTTLIDWNTKALNIPPKKEVKGWVIGYGASEAKWNESRKAWEAGGTTGNLAWGQLTLDSSTYEDGQGRLCSKGKEGTHGIISGDSGGPLLGPDGHLRGINSSFSHGTKAEGYESCFTDIAGHLNWIHKIMDKDGCKTIPPVAPPKLNLGLNSRPNDEKIAGREAKHFQSLLSYVSPNNPAAATLALRAKLLEDTFVRNPPKSDEEKKKRLEEIEKAREAIKNNEKNFQRLYTGKNRTHLNMDSVSNNDKERLRNSLGEILKVDSQKQKVIFLGPIIFGKEGAKITYGFCAIATPVPSCPTIVEGTATVLENGISIAPKSGQGKTILYK